METSLENLYVDIGAELTNTKTSGTVNRDRKKNWPIAERRIPANDPRNNCGTHFCPSPLLLSKVTNVLKY